MTKKPNEFWYRLSGLNGGPLVPQSSSNRYFSNYFKHRFTNWERNIT